MWSLLCLFALVSANLPISPTVQPELLGQPDNVRCNRNIEKQSEMHLMYLQNDNDKQFVHIACPQNSKVYKLMIGPSSTTTELYEAGVGANLQKLLMCDVRGRWHLMAHVAFTKESHTAMSDVGSVSCKANEDRDYQSWEDTV